LPPDLYHVRKGISFLDSRLRGNDKTGTLGNDNCVISTGASLSAEALAKAEAKWRDPFASSTKRDSSNRHALPRVSVGMTKPVTRDFSHFVSKVRHYAFCGEFRQGGTRIGFL